MHDFEDLLNPARQLALLDLTHDTIMIRDREDRILYWNRGAERRYGWYQSEAIGTIVHDLLQTQFPEPLETIQAELTREGRWEGELVHTCRNGQQLVVASRWALEPGEGDNPGLIFEMNNDISPRKHALEALRRSQESMQVAVEAAHIVTWDWNLDSPSFTIGGCQTLLESLPRDLRQGAPEALLDLVHPDDRPLVRQEIQKALQGRGAISVEFRTLDTDDGIRWFALDGRAVAGSQGTPQRMTGILRETTERKTLEQQFQASQKLEVVGRLAGGIAHDFNNLLTAIFGFADLGETMVEPDSRLAKAFHNIRLAAERGGELTRQLLGFARRQIISPKVINLEEAVQRSEPMLRKVLGERVQLVMVPAHTQECARMDPGQFDQVLLNLATNARDAMPEGGVLTIETQRVDLSEDYARKFPEVMPGEYVMVAISDTGVGMSSETMQHVFEPFFTTKGKHKGTGLGLATCYGIVKQNHGHIWLYSEPGRGTTFKIYLPLALAPQEEGEALRSSEPMEPPPGGTETILVVDDDPGVREIALASLSDVGYTTLAATCGDEALERAATHPGPIQFLLTDVVMPGLSVTEFVERLLTLRPGIRVLFMSGYTENAIVHQGMLDSGRHLLQKPFTVQQLLRAVRNHLDQ